MSDAQAGEVRVLSSTTLAGTMVHEVEFSVSTGDAPGESFRCAATMTVPTGCGETLQILVHGATYNRWYWDPAPLPEKYSYVRAAAARGHATVNLDLVGSGRSAHPDGTRVGLDLHAATVDQIAMAARKGIAGHRWDTVVGVGHSLGSCVLMVASSGHRSLDAAVLTGIGHQPPADPPEVPEGLGHLDAERDPAFQGRAAAGYVTLPAGSRPFYYHLPRVTPAILFADERHRDVVGMAALEDYAKVMERPCEARVPLLIALGARDRGYAVRDDDEFRAAESGWYPRAPAVDFRFYPDTGHNINLHDNADRVVDDLLGWVEQLKEPGASRAGAG